MFFLLIRKSNSLLFVDSATGTNLDLAVNGKMTGRLQMRNVANTNEDSRAERPGFGCGCMRVMRTAAETTNCRAQKAQALLPFKLHGMNGLMTRVYEV